MNISEQIHLKLQLKENSEVEYKSAAGGFPKAEFWRSFSALANTNGGTIILGVNAENGGYPPTQNGDIRSLFWLFSLMALQN